LMLSAQARGHELFYYDVKSLAWQAGRVTAEGAPVKFQRVAGDHFSRGEFRKIDLGSDIDVVLMRHDPPFDLGYITATHLL
ncbi:glutathione synthase, partial [Staphylococcus aureus]